MKFKMKKVIFLVIVIVASFFEYSRSVFGEDLKEVKIQNIDTTEQFYRAEENLVYNVENVYTEYHLGKYTFKRYSDFLRFGDGHGEVIVTGSKFVLTDKEIWFISDRNRTVRSVYYTYIDYLKNTYANIEDEYIRIHENIDVDSKSIDKFNRYENMSLKEDEKVAMTFKDISYTVVVDGNEIFASRERNEELVYSLQFPFKIVEVSFSDPKDINKFNFRGSDGTVGKIIVTQEGLDYYISGQDAIKLCVENEEKNIVVQTHNNWVIYYNADYDIIASDGEMSFNLSECEYEKTWVDSRCGISKGYSNLAIVFKRIADNDFESMEVEELSKNCEF